MSEETAMIARVLATEIKQAETGAHVSRLSEDVKELMGFQRSDSGEIRSLQQSKDGSNARLKTIEGTLSIMTPEFASLKATVVTKEALNESATAISTKLTTDLATATAAISSKLDSIVSAGHESAVSSVRVTTKLDTKQALIYGVVAAVASGGLGYLIAHMN